MTDPLTLQQSDGAPFLAVDLQPATGGRGDLVLDVSSLDGPDRLGYPGAGWQNFVCDVSGVSLRRGATRLQGPLTRAEGGTCTVTVSDTQRLLDPLVNGDAVHRGIPFRLRAWGWTLDGDRWDAVLFTGAVDEMAVSYDKAEPPTVTLWALDLIGDLAAWGSAGYPDPGVGSGDNLLDRVQRVLTEVQGSAAAISADSDPHSAYVATLASSALSAGWDDMTAAQDAELGRLWVSADNHLVVRSRFSQLSGPVRGTLSDVHGETVTGPHSCYTDPAVVYGTEQLVNRAVVTRRVPNTGTSPSPAAIVQVDDDYSGGRYGFHAHPSSGGPVSTELETDAQLTPWGQALVTAGTEPRLRVESITPDPTTAPDAWPAVCATDVGDRWAFRLTPAVGPVVDRTLGVLGIAMDLTPDAWTITWHTDEAPTPGSAESGGWLLLDASSLDSGDLLAPFAVAIAA